MVAPWLLTQPWHYVAGVTSPHGKGELCPFERRAAKRGRALDTMSTCPWMGKKDAVGEMAELSQGPPSATSPASLVALSSGSGVHLSLGEPHQLIKLAWNKSEWCFDS